jgi:hypothetical protein
VSWKGAAGPNASNPINNRKNRKKLVLFVFVAVVPPGLHITVISDSMVVSAGRVGEGLCAIGARVGLLASVDVLMCLEMELGREALTALRTDNRANLQMDGSNVPLHQTRARLKPALSPTCIVPNTPGLSTTHPLDVIVGIDGRRGTGSGRRRGRVILGGRRRRGRCRRRQRRASGGMRVAGEVAAVTGTRGCWVGV